MLISESSYKIRCVPERDQNEKSPGMAEGVGPQKAGVGAPFQRRKTKKSAPGLRLASKDCEKRRSILGVENAERQSRRKKVFLKMFRKSN